MRIERIWPLEKCWLATWKILHSATTEKNHPFRTFSLASIDNNKVVQRTVVLRTVEKYHLVVFTDFRSNKVNHFLRNPSASLLFYDSTEKFQCRISANTQIYTQQHQVEKYLHRIKGEARLSYSSVLKPGEPLSHPGEAYQWNEKLNFCVLTFVPFEVEILQLDQNNHFRANFHQHQGDWQGSWIQP